MLRLTVVAESDASVTVRVEGRVLADSVSLLETECRRHLSSGHKVVLDFSGVTVIDSRGAAVVRGLKRHNLELTECWPLIEEQIAWGDGQ
ncbi:MAG: STAS domain-containing protein [Acidobacteria bacterium]|nr:STAS domain-containing protein [Acidobacteriota bacterium]